MTYHTLTFFFSLTIPLEEYFVKVGVFSYSYESMAVND